MKETKQGALPGTAAQARQLKAWLKENGEKPGAALPALQKAQEIYGYVPREVQQLIADALHKPLTEIYGVSTFYSQFNLEPKGRNRISVCLGTACYIKGGGRSISCSRRNWALETGAAPRTAASAWMPAAAWAAAGWRR